MFPVFRDMGGLESLDSLFSPPSRGEPTPNSLFLCALLKLGKRGRVVTK